MGKKDEFDLDEEPSFWVNILVTVLALGIVVAVVVGAYFLFFREGAPLGQEAVKSGVSEDVAENVGTSEGTAVSGQESEPQQTEPTEAPTQKPIADVGEENPTGMGQDPEATGQEGVSGIQDATENQGEATPIATPEPVNVEAGHNFTEVNEVVTAKDATNLRNMPSQGEESKVMVTLHNGQVATRIGISDSGWSKVTYDGKTYYAVSSYLTTDLTPPTPVPEDDGIKTVFTECDEIVAPKIEVNLRTLPSVTNPESVVVVKLPYGTQVRRTGINTDVGWSRVEYEGQVLYCVSSYVFVVEPVSE